MARQDSSREEVAGLLYVSGYVLKVFSRRNGQLVGAEEEPDSESVVARLG